MNLSGKLNKPIAVDLLFILFAGIIFITYDYQKDMLPDGLLFSIQLCAGWFLCRVAFSYFPSLPLYFCFALLLFGLMEAVWGLVQLYDLSPSKHRLFKITGTFMNPGPYGGFIALMFPLALHYWLFFKDRNRWIGYLFLFVGAICVMVFPATLSRTAWIAAMVGCLLVLLADTRILARICIRWRHRKKQCVIISVILCLFLSAGLYGVYHLKKDSADGRLFMWKITALAIKESPLKGSGFGGFPAAYAETQKEYFKNGRATGTEKLVAGSPDYAFNEYLQIFLEQGLIGIILFLMLSFLIIKRGVKNSQGGAAGSFLALSVFAFASYPYRLWEFPVIWVLLGAVCVSGVGCKNVWEFHLKRKNIGIALLMAGALCTVSILCAMRQKEFHGAIKEWKRLQPIYKRKAYASVINDYVVLYPLLDHKRKFVFEYGMMLNATGEKMKADSIFARGLTISCDPMFYNVKGRNHYEMGEYDNAGDCYQHSIWLLPERIYPYFLQTKLYADTANYQPEKMIRAANAVLHKEPKVHSTAIREMREEVRRILKEKGVMNE